ncbi:hypothetical protein WJX74_009185 [Apatococcus lobatus]|uniref:Uncharacterized protein n=1 Tax=Apatococcus lobatus TaxID=904363 RepID=A0AAW1RX80_9CHLO
MCSPQGDEGLCQGLQFAFRSSANEAAIQRKDAELEERGRLLYKSKIAIEQLQSELEAAQRGEDEADKAAQKAAEERDAALKLAEEGGAGAPSRAARLSQLEDQLSTGAQREGVLQSQLADALQQCADQVKHVVSFRHALISPVQGRGPLELTAHESLASSSILDAQEKWLEEQKADILDLEGQLTSTQARAAELEERLADESTSHIDQGRVQDQQASELKELHAQLSSTQSHQTRLRAQLYEARQAASAQAVAASKLQDDLGIVKDLNVQLQAQLSAAQSTASEQEHIARDQVEAQATLKQQLFERESGLADADAQLKQMQQDRERWERTFRDLGQQAQSAAGEKQAALAQLKEAEAAKEKLQEQLWLERQSSQQLRQQDATAASSHQQQLEAARRDGLAKAAAAEASAELHIQALSHQHQEEKIRLEREWQQKVADSAAEASAAAAKQEAEERAGWDLARCKLEERWTTSLKDLEAKAAAQCASHEAHTAQEVKAMEKKWRRKVKEARAEKDGLRSELAGRLALLADRMTQLASKEARHETRQVDLAKAVDELRSAGQGESRRRWELEGALREAATIFKRELCDKNETLRTLQSELRHMRKWHARALEGLPSGPAAWPHHGGRPQHVCSDHWLTLPAASPGGPWQAASFSSPAQPGNSISTPVHGHLGSWADASIDLDPTIAPERPAHLPTTVTTPGTNSHIPQLESFSRVAQPSFPPASSMQARHQMHTDSQNPTFPQPSFASPAKGFAASPHAKELSSSAPQQAMQQSLGTTPARSQGVQNFNAQPPGPSRDLSAQFSQPPDHGMPRQQSLSAEQPNPSPPSTAHAQQSSIRRQPINSWGHAGRGDSADRDSGRQQSGPAQISKQSSLRQQGREVRQNEHAVSRQPSGPVHMSQQQSPSRWESAALQPFAYEQPDTDRWEASAAEPALASMRPPGAPSQSGQFTRTGFPAQAQTESKPHSLEPSTGGPSGGHSKHQPAQSWSGIGQATFKPPGSSAKARVPLRHQSTSATDRGAAPHASVHRRNSLFDISPGPMLTYPVVPMDAVDMATHDTSAMLETANEGGQDGWQGFSSPHKQQQQQQIGEAGWLQRTAAESLLESPRSPATAHSRSHPSTEASLRMNELVAGEATPNQLRSGNPAQQSKTSAPASVPKSLSGLQPQQTFSNEARSTYPQQQTAMDMHTADTDSSPEARSAEFEPVSSSKRSSSTLRDSLEDQLRSLQAQYDRVIAQERAIDAAAEQSLSRKPSAQPQTLIRAHRSGGSSAREGMIDLAPPSKQPSLQALASKLPAGPQSTKSGMSLIEPQNVWSQPSSGTKERLEGGFGSAALETAY